MWWIWIIIIVVIIALTTGGFGINRRRGRNGKSNRSGASGDSHQEFSGQNQNSNTRANAQFFENQKKIWYTNLNKSTFVTDNLYEKMDQFPFFSSFTNTKQWLFKNAKSQTKVKEVEPILDDLDNQFLDIFSGAEKQLLASFNELGLGNSMQGTYFATEMYLQFLNQSLPITVNYLYATSVNAVIDYCNGEMAKSALIDKYSKAKREYGNFLVQAVNELVQRTYQAINQGYQSFEGQQSSYQDYFDDQQYDDSTNEEQTTDIELTAAYTTLEIDETATDDEVKKAYKKLAIKYHPDKNKTPEAAEKMTKVNAAYTLIKKVRGM